MSRISDGTLTEDSPLQAADEFSKLKLQSKTDIAGKTTQKKLNEASVAMTERRHEFYGGFGQEHLVKSWIYHDLPSGKLT
jgi:hypothetical protein